MATYMGRDVLIGCTSRTTTAHCNNTCCLHATSSWGWGDTTLTLCCAIACVPCAVHRLTRHYSVNTVLFCRLHPSLYLLTFSFYCMGTLSTFLRICCTVNIYTFSCDFCHLHHHFSLHSQHCGSGQWYAVLSPCFVLLLPGTFNPITGEDHQVCLMCARTVDTLFVILFCISACNFCH